MQKTKKTRKPFTFDYPAYYKKNEAKLKEYKAAWYQTNKERLREPMLKNQKRYTKRHPQKVAARKKAWDMNNKEHISTYRKKRYKSKLKHKRIEKLYGLTVKDYNSLLDSQNGCCAICKIPQTVCNRPFNVDHNHDTGKVRGLLCSKCNMGLGLFNDSLIILNDAKSYLESK